MIRENELVIDDFNYREHVSPIIDGDTMRHGLSPRNYSSHPVGYYQRGTKFDLPLIPRNEWSSRIKDKVQAQSQLSDIRLRGDDGKPIPSRDQNGKRYCWAHSGTAAVVVLRALMGLPYASLSAYAIACVIKSYRDEGGWGAQGLDFIMDRGVPSEKFWPQQSMSRSNDNPQTWENAALHKVSEGFIDMDAHQYDRKLSFDQEATCLLLNTPVIKDENWWGHSICGLDLVEVDSSLSLTDQNRWGVRIWNSWGDSWSDRGMGILKGSKAVSDGATSPRVTNASES